MSQVTDQSWSYIGRATKPGPSYVAGEVICVIVDCPEMQKHIGVDLKSWVDDGLTIERVPTAWVQKNFGTTAVWDGVP